MMEITILGTSSMVPTKERNVSGTYVELDGKGLLFDCGEGTQRQMNIAGLNRNKIRYICISHWHADHMAGLLGLMQTMQNNGMQNGGMEKVILFGPVGSQEHFDHLMKASIFDNKVNIEVKEFNCETETKIFENEFFSLNAINVRHGTPCLAYSLIESDKRRIVVSKLKQNNIPEGPHLAILQNGKDSVYEGKALKLEEYTELEKGKKITYVVDTCFINTSIEIAKDSDLLLAEATFTEAHDEKAESYFHMTSRQAAQVASMSNSKKLILCHISQRYKITTDLLEEAKDVFPNTEIAFDFMKIKVK